MFEQIMACINTYNSSSCIVLHDVTGIWVIRFKRRTNTMYSTTTCISLSSTAPKCYRPAAIYNEVIDL